MKKNLYLIVIFTITSCYVAKPTYSVSDYTIDYSKYYQDGFFITEATSVSFEYKPISSVMIVSKSGYEVIGKMKRKIIEDDGTIRTIDADKYGSFKIADIEDCFEKLYDVAQVKGANGAMNIKIEFSVNGWVLTGMLIKK